MPVMARLAALAVFGIFSTMAYAAQAQEACTSTSLFGSRPSTFNFRYENDHYAGQDQGYSSGLRWQFGSRNVAGEDCPPGSVRLAKHLFGWAVPNSPDELNLLVGVEH